MENQQVITTREIITQDVAKEILNRNHENQRTIIPNRLKNLKRELLEGRWIFNGETIKITTTGKLIDGQYRLMAVAQTGVEIDTLVVRGIIETTEEGMSTMSTIDSTSRTAKEALEIAGYHTEPLNISKLVRLIEGFNTKIIGSKSNGPVFRNSELVEITNSYNTDELLSIIDRAKRKFENNKDGYPLEAWLLLLYLEDKIPMMREFIIELTEFNRDDVGNPASMANRYMYNKRQIAGRNGGLMRSGTWYVLFMAFDKFRRNINTTRIPIPRKAKIKYPEDYNNYDI